MRTKSLLCVCLIPLTMVVGCHGGGSSTLLEAPSGLTERDASVVYAANANFWRPLEPRHID
ncbi:ABC-type enterochelin transport system ATPase subunit [Paraburkholderia sp. GAS448]|jgi:hypothetical protein